MAPAHHPPPAPARRVPFALLSVAVGLVVLLVAAWIVRLPPSEAPATTKAPMAQEDVLRSFLVEHRHDFQAKVAETARRDPGYRRALMAVDAADVRSLRGVGEARKAALWNLIRAAQESAAEDGRER